MNDHYVNVLVHSSCLYNDRDTFEKILLQEGQDRSNTKCHTGNTESTQINTSDLSTKKKKKCSLVNYISITDTTKYYRTIIQLNILDKEEYENRLAQRSTCCF